MNIFNYESKFNQTLLVIADMIILNILYIICCIPIVTIGAAQAGLFTGIRVLMDKDDDSSVIKAFFKGFSNGFKSITIVSSTYLLILAGLILILLNALAIMLAGGSKLAFILCAIGVGLIYTLHIVVGPFHASFGCTTRQLFRNSLYVTLAYLLRAVLSAVLVLIPVIIFFVRFDFFLAAIIGLLTIYYSVAYFLIFALWKKPLQSLKESFLESQKTAQEPEIIEEEISEE